MTDAAPTLQRSAQGQIIYRPDGVVLRAFLRDRSHVSIIRGPIGSGKSGASCLKIWSLACEQQKGPDGIRRSRWGIVRNTYPDLINTTVKTWLDWFPEERYGTLTRSRPLRQVIRIADVELEVLFFALDSEDDVAKMRSLEVTGWWFNEAQYIEKAIIDEAESRTGRFPAVKDGGSAWDGMIMDMNAPNEDHWCPLMMGEVPLPDDWTEEDAAAFVKPVGWSYFVQPPAMLEVFGPDGKSIVGYRLNPAAENQRWLKRDQKTGDHYYDEKIRGKSRRWIASNILNRIGLNFDGKPVWTMFSEETHVAKMPLKPIPGHRVIVGLDFGRQPAAICGQIVNNRWIILSELIGHDQGSVTFAPRVKRHLEENYRGHTVEIWGDPKGRDKPQSHEQSSYDIFQSVGLRVNAAPVKGNDIDVRLEAVEYALNGLHDGQPRFLLSPACRTLKVGMAGGYHYRKIQGTARYSEEPLKNKYSHPADALQYLLLGGGEGRQMIGISPASKSIPVNTRAKPKSRRRGPGAAR